MSYESKIYCKLEDILLELRAPKRDSEITCVEENSNLYILQFSLEDETYHVYDFSGNDVTGTVTPVKCEDTPTIALTSNGVLVADWTSFTLPINVSSVSISAQTGNFDISFDGWLTTVLTAREWVREFGDGNTIIANSDQIVITSHWNIDVIREII